MNFQYEHNHDNTPPPTDRQRWVFWLLWIGIPFVLAYLHSK